MPVIKSIFYGSVARGEFLPLKSTEFKAAVQRLEGQEVMLTIAPKRKPRSAEENRYYWGVVVSILSDELGLIPEEVHDIVKNKFLLNHRIKTENGKVVWAVAYPRSTSTLSTSEFEDLMSKVRMWAASEFKIYIPLPNEVDIGQF